MRARQLDGFFDAVDMNRYRAARDHRQLELRDLVALGQIRIKVILARKYRAARNVVRLAAIHCQPKLNGALHGLRVQHRQRAGQC